MTKFYTQPQLVIFVLAFALSSNGQTFQPYLSNPFSLSQPSDTPTACTLGDLNGDGMLDIVTGDGAAGLVYYQNSGSPTNPSFANAQQGPFGLSSPPTGNIIPVLVDLNNNGALDIFYGDASGNYGAYINAGSPSSPNFTQGVGSPFGLPDLSSSTDWLAPAFADLDNDGDLDLLAGCTDGFYFHRNMGSTSIPSFTDPAQLNPFGLSDLGLAHAGAFVDFDQDGDFDLLSLVKTASADYEFYFFKNSGSVTDPIFDAPVINPFTLNAPQASTANYSFSQGDLTGDGYPDLFYGQSTWNSGSILFWEMNCYELGSTDLITECQQYTWIDNVTYTSDTSGVTFALQNTAGCDSIVTLDLTINYDNWSNTTDTACGSYTWNGVTYENSVSGAYAFLTNQYGCDSVAILDLTILDNPIVTVTNNSPTLSADANGPDISYQWIDCLNGNSPIPNEMSQTFTAATNGEYAVVVDNGNCVDTSACVSVNNIGLSENELAFMQVYPNPTFDGITINFETAASGILKVIDPTGREVYSELIQNELEKHVVLPEATGIYLIQLIEDEKINIVQRVLRK